MMFVRIFVIGLVLFLTVTASAKTVRILFVGNSFTYYPGTPDDPGLPKMLKEFVQAAEPDVQLQYEFQTPGGYNLQQHRDKGLAQSMLLSGRFDYLVLQGQSIEALELTPYLYGLGKIGREQFLVNARYFIKLAQLASTKTVLFAHWHWHKNHPWRQESHPGLFFPVGHSRQGEKWTGESDRQFQDYINEGYQLAAAHTLAQVAYAGEAWYEAIRRGGNLVTDKMMYLKDGFHPKPLGTYLAVCVLYRTVFGKSPTGVNYRPEGVSLVQAQYLQNTALSVSSP